MVNAREAGRVLGRTHAGAVVLVRPEGAGTHQLLVALAETVSCPVFVIGPHGLAELLSA